MSEALQRHMTAKFTPEKLARMRRRIGIPSRPTTVEPFNTIVHADTIRHYVNGGGDDNPLFCDPAYAATTRWGGVIAPMTYLNTMGERDPQTPPWTPEQKEAMGGGDPLRGIHAFMSGATWECYRPIRPGRRILSRQALVGVIEKESAFADRSVLLPAGRAYRDAGEDGTPGELIAWREILMIHTERETAAKKGKYAQIERPVYTREQIAEIDAAYANEFHRGAETLHGEDVELGPIARPMVKGPLTVTDIIFWHQGGNERAYGLSPLRLAWKNRQRIPAFYLPNAFGAWDAAQRCHWDDALAQAVGNPYAYDYGAMREAWFVQFVQNWMGDDGWIWRFHAEMRRFNYIGDTTWIRGEVTSKRQVDEGFAVALAIRGVNQRDETTTVGWATILLPSRRQGAVRLPDPPAGARTIEDLFEAKVAGYRDGVQPIA